MAFDTTITADIADADIQFFECTSDAGVNIIARWKAGTGTLHIRRKVRGVVEPALDQDGLSADYTANTDQACYFKAGEIFGVGVSSASSLQLSLLITGSFIKLRK